MSTRTTIYQMAWTWTQGIQPAKELTSTIQNWPIRIWMNSELCLVHSRITDNLSKTFHKEQVRCVNSYRKTNPSSGPAIIQMKWMIWNMHYAQDQYLHTHYILIWMHSSHRPRKKLYVTAIFTNLWSTQLSSCNHTDIQSTSQPCWKSTQRIK